MMKYLSRDSKDVCIYKKITLVKLYNPKQDIMIYNILQNNNMIRNLKYIPNIEITFEMRTLNMLKSYDDINIDELRELTSRYLKMGLLHNDISRNNLGYDKNGNLEFVDYDSFTLFNGKLDYIFTYLYNEHDPDFNYKLTDLENELKQKFF